MDQSMKSQIKLNVDEQLKEHKYIVEKGENMEKKKAVGSENGFTGIKIKGLKGKEDTYLALNALIPNHIQNDNIVYVCIGTDRSTGDSLAPFVGTYLKSMGYENVYGTLEEPVHAMNLADTIDVLPENKTIIAIDAGLGQVSSIGFTQIIKGSIHAGAGIGRDLPPCGDYGIMGIVNVGGFMEYMVLQNTRLSLVVQMAKDITSALMERFPLNIKGEKFVQKKEVKDEILVKKIKEKGLNAILVK